MRVTATLVLGTVSLTIMLTEFNEGGESICAEDFFSKVLKVLRFNLSCQLCRHHAVEFCRAYQRNPLRLRSLQYVRGEYLHGGVFGTPKHPELCGRFSQFAFP